MRLTSAIVLLAAVAFGLSGCERKDYGTVVVPADHTTYNASGYSLRLPPGWWAKHASGGINYYPPDASPPFKTNLFVKTGPLGARSLSSAMGTIQRELDQYMTDTSTWDEQAVRVGGAPGRQARFSGMITVPGGGPVSVQGLIVAVAGEQHGCAMIFFSKTADYSRYESAVEQIIASLQPGQ
jgi:hypothetical protein